jgi:polysaccharide biosynthesis transport protein
MMVNPGFCPGFDQRPIFSPPERLGRPVMHHLPSVPPDVGPEVGVSPDARSGHDELVDLRQRSQQRSAQLRAWWDVVLRGKWLIAAITLAVLLPWTWYTMRKPDQYQATSVVLVKKRDGDLNNVLPTNGGAMMLGSDRRLGNELIIRESFPLAQKVAAQIQALGRVPETREPLPILQEGSTDVNALASRLQGRIQVGPTARDADGVGITATSTVPGEAMLISRLFAEAYIERARDESRAGFSSSREFLESQIKQHGARLQEQEAALRNFMTTSGAVDLDQESSNLVSQVAGLQAGRDESQIELQMKRAEAASIQQELNAIQPRIAQRLASGVDRQITELQRRIGSNEARIETLSQNPSARSGAEAPDVAAARREEIAGLRAQNEELNARVRELSEQLISEAMAAGGVNPTEGNAGIARVAELRRQLVATLIEIAGLEGRTGVMSRRIGEYEGQLRAIPAQAMQLAQLQRARQSTERLYVALSEKLQEASVAEQSKLGYAEMVRAATRPGAPFAPNRRRSVIMGLLFGLGLGLGLAYLKVALDHRVHRPEDLRARGYTVLANVPALDDLVRRDFGGNERINVEGHSFDTRLVALLNPLSPEAEAYRSLRTAIHFSQPDRPVSSLMVTSANPGEGKSITIINLATVMAQAGRRVAVVDLDLRKPSLHTKFGLPREPGVVELLFDHAAPDFEQYATLVDDLYVITAGARVPNSSELIGSRAMRALHDRLRSQFDIVLYDAPPALVAADAPLLASFTDGALLVVSAGRTKDYELEHALEALVAAHANILGTVLNRFDSRQAYAYRYRYRSYGYNGYRYGNGNGYGYGDGAAGASTTASFQPSRNA